MSDKSIVKSAYISALLRQLWLTGHITEEEKKAMEIQPFEVSCIINRKPSHITGLFSVERVE